VRPLAILVLAVALAAVPAPASVCAAPPATQTATPRWTLDRYIFDASLNQDWAVLVDCNHPQAPARMKLASNTAGNPHAAKRASAEHRLAPIAIKAGTAVEVSNGADAFASIRLTGTAMETAFPGQPIRVRLSAGGRMVRGYVRGSHSVELAAEAKPSWGEQ
jgi:hypothetical protein